MDPRLSARLIAQVTVATAIVMGGVILVGRIANVPTWKLTGDAAAIMGSEIYIGAITSARVLLLTAAAAACLLTATVVRRRAGRSGELLGALGAFSVLLVFDDQFQLHEAVLDRGLGVPQPVTYAAYAALAAAGALRYGKLVLSLREGGLLVIAFIALGLAAVVDTCKLPLFTSFIEACLEVFAIGCLASFELRLSLSTLRKETQP